MKGKFLQISKKALSVILSVCLMLTVSSVAFSIFAAEPETAYTVTYGSPAIPMYENKMVNLNNFEVEFEKGGTPVNGAEIEWSVVEGGNIFYISSTNTLMAFSTGIAKLSAKNKATNETRNIYVVVEKAGATEFKLMDYDFANYNPDDWYALEYSVSATTGTAVSSITNATDDNGYIAKGNGFIRLGSNNGVLKEDGGKIWCLNAALVSKNEVVKAFSDYTVTTTVNAYSSNGTNSLAYTGPGIVARARMTEDGVFDSAQSGLLTYVESRGSTVSFKVSNKSNILVDHLTTYEGTIAAEDRAFYKNGEYIDGDAGDTFTANDTAIRTIVQKFDGEHTVVTRDKFELFDSAKNTNTTLANMWTTYQPVNNGAVGIVTHNKRADYYTLKVSLNAQPADITPYLSDINLYAVSASSPALPMTLLTEVAFDKFVVEIDGEVVPATAVNFTSSNNGAIKVTDTGIAAYKVGATAITAEYNGKTTTVYAVVKEESDTEWVLYQTDFTEGDAKDLEGWSVYTQVSESDPWIKSNGVVSDFVVITEKIDGRASYTGNKVGAALTINSGTGLKWGSTGALVLDNEIVKAFSDYKITATVHGKNGWASDRGFGLFGRGTLSGEDTSASINFDTLIYSVKSVIPVAAYGVFDATLTGSTTTKIAKNTDYDLYNNPVNFTYEFSGDSLKFKVNDGATVTDTANTANKGVVGVYAALYENIYFAVTENFKVSLCNASDNYPEYTPINLYKVSETAPAIPMNAFSVLDTSNFLVELDGTYILGSDVTFELAESTKNIEINGDKITAYIAGTYKLNATLKSDSSVSKAVYLVVKEKNDKKWTLYSADFDGDETHTDWKTMFNSSSKWGTFPIGENYIDTNLPATTNYNFMSGTRSGFVPYKAGYTDPVTGAVSADAWGGTLVFYTTNEMLNSFVDYTVDLHFHGNSGYHGGYGILGRVNIDEKGELTSTTAAAGFNVNTSMQETNRGVYNQTAIDTVATERTEWDYTNTLYNHSTTVLGNHYYTLKLEEEKLSISSPKDDNVFTATTNVTQAGSIAIRMNPIFGSNNDCSEGSLAVHSVTVTLNNSENDLPVAKEIKMHSIEASDPTLVMYENTSDSLRKLVVQLSEGGEAHLATDVTFNTNGANGIEITNGADGKITAYSKGTYKVTATCGEETKDIYVFVVKKGTSAVEIFHDDFSNGVLDYNVWQQTEYYWGEATQVTAPKDLTANNVMGEPTYTEGVNLNKQGAVPFVTNNYWDAITLGGSHSNKVAGGSGYSWSNIYMNNVVNYAYIKEGYVTESGVKLSDLGVYDVSASMTLLNPGNIIKEYNQSTDTYSGVRFEYNGVGLMGRIDFAGEDYFKNNTSTMQNVMWDASAVIIKAAGNSGETLTNSSLTNTFGGMSLKASYRSDNIKGTFIPNNVSKNAGFSTGEFTAELSYANSTTGSVGFYSEGRDIDIYDFTVSYPVTEVFGAENTITAMAPAEISVPVNTTIDLTRYNFATALESTVNEYGEIDTANNTFTAFKAGGSVASNGTTFTVTNGTLAGTKKLVNIVGNGTASVSSNGKGSYTLTATAGADNILVKAGAVTVKLPDGTLKNIALGNDNTATFTTNSIGNTEITVEFIEKTTYGFESVGATIRLKDEANGITDGIRFAARINNIRKNGDKILADEKITINGNQYNFNNVGTLLLPTALLGDRELNVDNAETLGAINKIATIVYSPNENYAFVTATLVGIPESMKSTDITFRAYLKYTDDAGNPYYVYTDEIERSYNYVMKVAPISITNYNYGSNDVSILLTANKQNIKYSVGEEMTVSVDTYIDGTPASGIPLDYAVYSGTDDGYSGEAIATGNLSSLVGCKINYKPSSAGYYYIVVKANKGETTVMTNTIRLGAGIASANGTDQFDENNIATKFAVTSDAHIYKDMTSAHNQHLVSALKVLNNAAGYYSDGTQKLDAFLIAGDITNAVNSTSNYGSSSLTVEEYDDLIYGEVDAFRNIMNQYLGDTQLFYSFGNHDSAGGTAEFKKKVGDDWVSGGYTLSVGQYYSQILSGKTANTTAEKHFNSLKDYSDSKDYIKYFGRDEETTQQLNYGNRVMRLNGITFVALEALSLQNGYARYTESTLNFLRKALETSVANDPSMPVFIITHYRPDGTCATEEVLSTDGTSNNIADVLKDYPQAFVWSGHVHDALQSESTIIQTRTVDADGNVVDNGFTSISTASIGYTSSIYGSATDHNGSQAQMVEVDVNGNVRITRYLIDSSVSGQSAVTTDAAEISLDTDGQYKFANSGAVTALGQIFSNSDRWIITNAVDDSVRDEYEPLVRSKNNKLTFASDSITLSGKVVTFPKATPQGTLKSYNMPVMYVAVLYDAEGTELQKIRVARNIQKYSNLADIPVSDTYTATFSKTVSGGKIVVTAYDAFAAWNDASKYPTLTLIDVTF